VQNNFHQAAAWQAITLLFQPCLSSITLSCCLCSALLLLLLLCCTLCCQAGTAFFPGSSLTGNKNSSCYSPDFQVSSALLLLAPCTALLFQAGTAFFPGSSLTGNGLLVSDGVVWRAQRRMANPAFRKAAVDK
jgi:hypothetical protein